MKPGEATKLRDDNIRLVRERDEARKMLARYEWICREMTNHVEAMGEVVGTNFGDIDDAIDADRPEPKKVEWR